MKQKQSENFSLLLLAFAYLFFAQFAPFVHSHDHAHHSHADVSILHSLEFCQAAHDVHDDDHHHGCCQVSTAQSVALHSAKVDKADFSQGPGAVLANESSISELRPAIFTISILRPANQGFFQAVGTRAPPSIV